MNVIKRDGRIVPFNANLIKRAISKAGNVKDSVKEKIAQEIANLKKDEISVEEIQDIVEKKLMATSYKDVAKEYIRYRQKRELIRESEATNNSVLQIISHKNEYLNTENSNKNTMLASTQRDYMAGEVSKDISKRLLLTEDIVEAHELGKIHFHDMDYFAQTIHNCCLVNIQDMLQNGTVISGTKIDKPHSFSTACNIATQIMANIASCQYGGQSENLSDLVPFVDVSRQKIRKKMLAETEPIKDKFETEEEYNEYINKVTEDLLKEEIKKGVQTIQYQINTLMTTNGQTPFVTIFMYLGAIPEGPMRDDFAMVIEEVVKQRIQGTKNEKGAWITPAFPKLVYVLEEDNIHEDSKYWYLTKLCAACSAKRLVPDYVSEKKMLEFKKGVDGEGHVYSPMGCRSFLTVWNPVVNGNETVSYICEKDNDVQFEGTPEFLWNKLKDSEHYELKDGKLYPKKPCYIIRPYAGRKDKFKIVYFFITEEGETRIQCASDIFSARFNQGVVTVNLPYIALESGKDMKKFWEIFEERMNLCHKALRFRHQRLKGTPSDVSPIHWQNGGLARLGKGEVIDPLLYGGYSTISLGYAGLFECVYYMTGHSHTDDGIGKEFAMEVMNSLNAHAKKWKAEENIDYSVYGTPIETTTEKFAKALSRDFGVIPEVSDHDYVTNSYHVSVREHIDPFKKLKLEGEFQRLSPGGCISYIETSDLTKNINAVMEVLKYIYENTMYAELNTKSDYCQVCGYDGEIELTIDKENEKAIWKCPNCGNTDQNKMNVARRTCGYIGSQFWGYGRSEEIKERVIHLGGDE